MPPLQKKCILCFGYTNFGAKLSDEPFSPYLFVICFEILVITVRNDLNIKGILKISDSETKLLQFADDTTFIFAQAMLKLLNDFENVSVLKVNIMRAKAIWIGSLQTCNDEPLRFKWKTCLNSLGIFIAHI